MNKSEKLLADKKVKDLCRMVAQYEIADFSKKQKLPYYTRTALENAIFKQIADDKRCRN